MSYMLFKNLKRSSVILLPEKVGEENWENQFYMTIMLAKNYNCSFHTIDLNQIIQRYVNWTSLLPRVKPFFCHTFQRDPKIAYILGSLGCGFSCASYREINDCLSNVPRLHNNDSWDQEVILSNPFKLGSEMKNCSKLGVVMTTFMCKSELDRIKLHWPEAELLIAVMINPELYRHEMTLSKFAAHPDKVDGLLEHAKSLDLNVVGLICYHGTHFNTVKNWSVVPKVASALVDKIEQYGFKVKIFSIGDGFSSIDQENEEHDWLSFQEDLSSLNRELDEYFPTKRGIKIIAQLAKYFVEKAELLAFKVMSKKVKPLVTEHDESDVRQVEIQNRVLLVIENSNYMSFNYHRGWGRNNPNFWLSADGTLKNLAIPDGEAECLSTIFGFTCDSLDVICEDVLLSESIAAGDYLLWVHRGAYGSCMMAQFNGMKPPKHFHFITKPMLTKFMELCSIDKYEDLEFNVTDL